MTPKTDLTRNQSLVLGALSASDGPLSAYEILDGLRHEGLRAPLQVYRALQKLTERGLAHRLESLNAFVACAGPDCHRTGLIGFAICDTCGQVAEFADDTVRERLGVWARAENFEPRSTVLEIRGLCGPCSAAATA